MSTTSNSVIYICMWLWPSQCPGASNPNRCEYARREWRAQVPWRFLLAEIVQLLEGGEAGRPLLLAPPLAPAPLLRCLQLLHLALQMVDVGLETLDCFRETVGDRQKSTNCYFGSQGIRSGER